MPTHAFLVGNWRYENSNAVGGNLTYPENDINTLKAALSGKTLDPCEIQESLNDTAGDMVDKLNTFVALPQPEDLLLVYYSGHGFPDGGHLCLAMHDTNRTNANRHVLCANFFNAIFKTKSNCVLVILDCCYSGLAAADLFESRGPRALIERTVQPIGFQDYAAEAASTAYLYRAKEREIRGRRHATKGAFLLTATEPLQVAVGKPEEKLGLFTNHVIKALSGGSLVRSPGTVPEEYGEITACSVFNYALEKMKGEEQTPQIFVRGADGPDLLITRVHDTISTSEPARTPRQWDEPPLFHGLGPVYILGETYSFVDWNAAFQHLVATPFCLNRGDDVKIFMKQLDNWESDVAAHSIRQFPAGSEPDVDTEVLQFRHPKYGLVIAQKFASRVRNDRSLWCVALHVTFVQRGDLWNSLMDVVHNDTIWTSYANCYDSVVAKFSQHTKLVEKVVEQIGSAPLKCLDVGAGTGSTTLELLRTPGRTVHAIEPNGKMVAGLRENLKRESQLDRVEVIHADCLGGLRQKADRSYDACVMMNVVFALDDPIACLKEIRRVLDWNAILSLSTSTVDTNINKLLDAIHLELSRRPEWKAIEAQYYEASARNREMEGIIRRYSEQDIRRFLEAAGFAILNIERNLYENCVIVIQAIKRKEDYLPPESSGRIEPSQ
ncbi:MAG TPA: methyltransferase domain-containing protein [Pirellulales bacterium]|jgi:ubiquinone/menaquinone biosynthesis C-methylase UbiE